MTQIIPFNFNGASVRVVMHEGEPWFVVSDICAVLGLTTTSRAVERVPDKHLNTLSLTQGIQPDGSRDRGNPNALVVSEAGLYRIVLRSDKPAAEPFIAWVTEDVLPTIRRTGQWNGESAIKLHRKIIDRHIRKAYHALERKLRDEFLAEVVNVNIVVRSPFCRDETFAVNIEAEQRLLGFDGGHVLTLADCDGNSDTGD